MRGFIDTVAAKKQGLVSIAHSKDTTKKKERRGINMLNILFQSLIAKIRLIMNYTELDRRNVCLVSIAHSKDTTYEVILRPYPPFNQKFQSLIAKIRLATNSWETEADKKFLFQSLIAKIRQR